MSRRVSLPGADELFRNTATLSAVPSQRENSEEITQAPVAAATPIVKYFAPSDAFSNTPRAANTTTPVNISVGAI